MVIVALDHVATCYSSSDGYVIANLLRRAFAAEDRVSLSFDGVDDVPSSFVNAALVSLLDDHSSAWLKHHLSVVDTTKQIADMIRRCIANAERTPVAA
jgi:hypothetical protein